MTVKGEEFTVVVNPTDEYDKRVIDAYMDNIHIVLSILLSNIDSFKQAVEDSYPYGLTWRPLSKKDGHYVSESGLYHYPEDPVVYPFAKYSVRDQTAYFYPMDMIVINDKLVARID
jgi:hypothetical protein